MATQRISFGEWLPDQPGLSGSLVEAKNVISQAIGYGPLPEPSPIALNAGENLYTLHHTRDSDNETVIVAAGLSNVYSISSIGAFTNVSGTSYSTPNDSRIRFTQFGSNIIFTNNADKLQYFDVNGHSRNDNRKPRRYFCPKYAKHFFSHASLAQEILFC